MQIAEQIKLRQLAELIGPELMEKARRQTLAISQNSEGEAKQLDLPEVAIYVVGVAESLYPVTSDQGQKTEFAQKFFDEILRRGLSYFNSTIKH